MKPGTFPEHNRKFAQLRPTDVRIRSRIAAGIKGIARHEQPVVEDQFYPVPVRRPLGKDGVSEAASVCFLRAGQNIAARASGEQEAHDAGKKGQVYSP
jgi:hypothetical protein